MADKRTFSREYMQKLFSELSEPACQLCILLAYAADNSGFVKTSSYVAASSGYSEADLTELLDKGFLLQLVPGIVLITHWHQNNYIRPDRRGKTSFQDLLSCVTLENEVYHLTNPPKQEKKQPARREKAPAPVKEEPTKRFVKPTIEEVRDFIREKNFSVDADAWYSHYESNGWMVGKNKMKDWRASVNYWQHNKTMKKGSGNTNGQCDKNALFPYQPQWYGGDATSSFGDGSFGSV